MMRTMNQTVVALMASALLASFASATPDERSEVQTTTITVPSMHCAGCAKKVANQLVQVKGVAKAQANMKTKTIKITPKAEATISPRALWEAAEAAGEVPSKLTGPGGTFTSKPKE